ncbi:OsmC family protein [Loktanella sp. DJP18]|uniref:OsmC family protein n=1 Tax=Loktanella sp. DJP18 TaxID=3409788 RepID=UPI003BB5A5FE
MGQIKQKTTIVARQSGVGQTHSRSHVRIRDVYAIIDEPLERGGSNLGPTPTETMMSSLIGCTNVISKKIAKRMGLGFGQMRIEMSYSFNRLGTLLQEEVHVPFDNIVLDIDVETDATPDQMAALKAELEKFCPVAKVFRAAGMTITENWSTRPLPDAPH